MSADTNRVGPTPSGGRSQFGVAVALVVVAAVVVGVTCGPASGAISSTEGDLPVAGDFPATGNLSTTAGSPPDLVVGEVSVSGAAVASHHNGTALLWPARPYSLTTTIENLPTTAEYRVCALTANTELNCTTTTLRPAGTAVELSVPGSILQSGSGSNSESDSGSESTLVDDTATSTADGGNSSTFGSTDGSSADAGDNSSVTTLSSGVRNVSISVTRVGANETVVVGQLASLRVLPPSGDFDGDGLSNRAERERGTDPAVADTDRDLLADGTEVEFGTNPLDRKTAVVFGVVGLFVLGVAVGLLYRFRSQLFGPLWSLVTGVGTALSSSRSDSAGRNGSGDDSETDATRRAPTRTGTQSSDVAGRATAADSSGERDAAGERRERGPRPDPSPPLSDEERVLRLLEENDGQLPQSDIVSQTPWSKSKVSRLLARMDAQDLVVKINAGRRNVIVLPGEEPDTLQSLHDRDDE